MCCAHLWIPTVLDYRWFCEPWRLGLTPSRFIHGIKNIRCTVLKDPSALAPNDSSNQISINNVATDTNTLQGFVYTVPNSFDREQLMFLMTSQCQCFILVSAVMRQIFVGSFPTIESYLLPSIAGHVSKQFSQQHL